MAKGNLGEGVIGLLVPGLGQFDARYVEFMSPNGTVNCGYPADATTAAVHLMREGCYVVDCPERGRLIVPLAMGVLTYGKRRR